MQVTVVVCCSVLMAALLSFFLLQTRPVYLVDFSVYKPPERCADGAISGNVAVLLVSKRHRKAHVQLSTAWQQAAGRVAPI